MAPPIGIIITVTVLVAASLAAYENPQVRAWIDRTRHKIAMGLHSLGDEIHPKERPRRPSNDASMHEEKGETAQARRQQAIADIMERGRIMEERRKRRKSSGSDKAKTPTFDSLVDEHGDLRHDIEANSATPVGSSSGVQPLAQTGVLKQRNGTSGLEDQSSTLPPLVDASPPLREISPRPHDDHDQGGAFESRYEQEMREAWNLPLAGRRIEIPSSHASESLIELTPTTEGAPDPEFSVPSAEYLRRPLAPSEYFSAAASNSTHALSDHLSQHQFPSPRTYHYPPSAASTHSAAHSYMGGPPTPRTDDGTSNIHASEAEDSADDVLSEVEDGIQTPASTWTEVDSTISGDFML